MAFIEERNTGFGSIGIWEIKETLTKLLDGFQFSEKEKEDFDKLSAERRKKEFLIVRLLLNKLLKFNPGISYEKSGRPILNHPDLQIGISHSSELVVVFVSKKRIGIDVENIGRNVEKIAPRFLHVSEIEFLEKMPASNVLKLMIWSAKEAIFKCSAKQGIQFNQQIIIQPFEKNETGLFYGNLINGNISVQFELNYFFLRNNVVVYCVEKEKEKR